MRSFLILLLLLTGVYSNSYALIGIGYSYKNVRFWRFWEMKDGILTPQILVYNTGDTALFFSMHKTFVDGGCKPSTITRQQYEQQAAEYARDTVVGTTRIPPHQYAIFNISKGQGGRGYNGAYVNGHPAGIAGMLKAPDKAIMAMHPSRYYSYETQYATPCFGFIATNDLFTRPGGKGSITIYYDFHDGNTWQFFSGITDISASINDGISEATLRLNGQSYSLDATTATQRFAANITPNHPGELDITYTVAPGYTLPDLDLRHYFQNGNSGAVLPIFVP